MIKYCKGDILKAKTQMLVNPVNCCGVMGAGLAKQFKGRYPEMFKEYKKACDAGLLEIGAPMYWKGPPLICNFPTKDHWDDCSYYSSIVYGLQDLLQYIKIHDIKSVAVPKLGCGLGGLDWKAVNDIIVDMFKDYTGELVIYN